MPDDILADLGIAPEDALAVSPRLRDRLVHFLLRWKHDAALEACLAGLIARRPLQVLLDARADMLLGQGRLAEAWDTMSQRHERSVSVGSRILAGRILLAQHDAPAVLQMAQELVREEPDSAMAWGFLGEVRLSAGDTQGALAAYRRANDLAPDSRAYALAMLSLYQARRDWVTASAYAVRLQESATPESSLPVTYLRRLRDYFTTSKEWNRVTDIEQELVARHAAELAGLKEALVQELGERAQRPVRPAPARGRGAAEAAAQPPAPVPVPDSFDQVPVSPPEREKIKSAVRRLFGFRDLLPGQAEIMACMMRGEDVLAVLPTGGGKSLCYQLPALSDSSGVTLVISPLIALMKDQVDKLPAGSAALATTINSSLEGDELRRRLEGVHAGHYRLVYAAPERLRQPPFLHALRRAGLNRMVVDEVHCVSMWGHDFRPDYLYIAEARRRLGHPPLLAMTATAPPRVRLDIVQRLGAMRVIAGEVVRSNLRLEVFRAGNQDDKLQHLLSFCRSEPGAGIIYAGTRARCEELAELLRSQGVAAIHYHAGIDNRAAMQDEFMSGRARVVVATIAFGMGIDKPDIRFILHYEPSASIEAYYQEAGRAGRDGLPARCVMMYAPFDRATLTRRARRGELSENFLRQAYMAIKKSLVGATAGRVVVDDLRRELQAEDTPVRVAISMLEQVGLVRRGQDIPRAISLRLSRTPPADDPGLANLCQSCHLHPGHALTQDPLQVAAAVALDARNVEEQLLTWSDAGLLECRASARDPLLQLLPAPPDSRERIRTLLEQYEQVQAQRVSEIVAYANTRRCRHGHISAYLGGRPIKHCASCDNCRPPEPQPVDHKLPDESAQLQAILQAVGAHGWGRHTLAMILRGDPAAPPAAKNAAGFGALAFRSEGALSKMFDLLQQRGFLEPRQLEHGGFMLQLTPAGRRALSDPSALRPLARPAARQATPKRRERRAELPVDVSTLPDDDPLFARLRAWRLDKARELGVSAFVIAHNALLRTIAAARPRTEAELSAVKGMGPRKLAQYGAEILGLVHEEHETDTKNTK